MQVVQTRLQQQTDSGGIRNTVAWLPVDPRVKKGSVISFKDEPESGTWKVVEMYVRQDSELIQRGWGLDLPKSQRTER